MNTQVARRLSDGTPKPGGSPTSTRAAAGRGGVGVLAASSEPKLSPDPGGRTTARSAGLDLHEGIADPRPLEQGFCARWPEHLRLLNKSTGELVKHRCRATNLCRYCQRLAVVETVEMLTLDAMEHAPTLWAVLTAREHLTRAQCRDHLQQLRRAARRRWPAIEWFVQVEFQRRGALHLNLLIKGVPVEDLAELEALLVGVWCSRVDARPAGQWFDTVADARGVVAYLSKMLAHGLKAEQAPPIGWRGHRTSQTRGYLVRPASVMREEARRSLRLKRQIHRLGDARLAEAALEQAESHSWQLVQLRDLGGDIDRQLSVDARRPFRLADARRAALTHASAAPAAIGSSRRDASVPSGPPVMVAPP